MREIVRRGEGGPHIMVPIATVPAAAMFPDQPSRRCPGRPKEMFMSRELGPAHCTRALQTVHETGNLAMAGAGTCPRPRSWPSCWRALTTVSGSSQARLSGMEREYMYGLASTCLKHVEAGRQEALMFLLSTAVSTAGRQEALLLLLAGRQAGGTPPAACCLAALLDFCTAA